MRGAGDGIEFIHSPAHAGGGTDIVVRAKGDDEDVGVMHALVIVTLLASASMAVMVSRSSRHAGLGKGGIGVADHRLGLAANNMSSFE